MGKKRFIDTRFWDDTWVTDRLNPLDRYLMLYFLTNNKTNIAGVYEISLRTVANETGIDSEEILKMVRRLEPRVRYMSGWVVIQNFIKHQNYKNQKIAQGIELMLELCPKELLNYVNCPNDWIPAVVKRETGNLQIGFDDSSMSQPSLSNNSNLNSNLNLNSKVSSDASHPTNNQDFLSNKKSTGKGYKTFTEAKKKLQEKKSIR